MYRGESSDDVDGSGASSKKMDETDNGTGRQLGWEGGGGRGVTDVQYSLLPAHHPHKNFVRLETLYGLRHGHAWIGTGTCAR